MWIMKMDLWVSYLFSSILISFHDWKKVRYLGSSIIPGKYVGFAGRRIVVVVAYVTCNDA